MSPTTRDTVVAGGWFAFGALLYAAGFHLMFITDDASSGPLAPRFALLALACAVLLVRRRAPVTAMVAGLLPLIIDLMLGPTLPIWLVYTDLIYAAVVYGTRRQMQGAVVAWLALSVTAAGAVLAFTGNWRLMVLALVLAAAFVGTSLWWGLTVRAHKETAEAERARRRALALVSELDRRAAVADERKAMARDLHDVIAGHLSAIALQSEAALAGLDHRTADPGLHGILTAIRGNSVEALHEMRTMIGLLRRDGDTAETAAPGRLAQLSRLVTAARHAGMRVRVHQDTGDIASAVDQAAYRIIQEAVTNAMKHAPGQEVDIDVRAATTALVLTVHNPLPPADPPAAGSGDPPAGRRGLTNMRERATALGGTFHAGPEAGGWWVRARLPLAPVAEPVGESR
ncbi:sensor histidine kinase [Nocardia sp. X0981]